MSGPKIVDGVWKRNIPAGWCTRSVCRTSISVSVLSPISKAQNCIFLIENGPACEIPISEVRRVLANEHPAGNGAIVFTLDYNGRTINGSKVQMIVR